ncbi:hypothetical protein [Micromonospora aurantiaca (nom. illeg.)]|uniref:hypothetical protein n=1 Tax=Micromonospora aurantiaca (nom. illeg.) TaxID=47850 RepID=UPI0011A1C3F3|nr:hypothetical protein [Micromonospora aurantiaca]MBC9005164.1 hypothetical protein [Micromonospora aurantiaca]
MSHAGDESTASPDSATWGEREVIAGLRTGAAHPTLQKGAANLIERLLRERGHAQPTVLRDAPLTDEYHTAGVYCGESAHCTPPYPGALPGTPYQRGELLTELEHKAMGLTAELWETLCHVVGTAASAGQDLAELAAPINALQHAILAQAAARAYPDRYRLLGGAITRTSAAGQ